jgi:hypothetical protein
MATFDWIPFYFELADKRARAFLPIVCFYMREQVRRLRPTNDISFAESNYE